MAYCLNKAQFSWTVTAAAILCLAQSSFWIGLAQSVTYDYGGAPAANGPANWGEFVGGVNANWAATFDYGTGPNGPAHWGELNANWTKCKTGKQQSPITISPHIMVADPDLSKLDASYSSEPVEAEISINVGRAVEVAVKPEAGVLRINDVNYRPAQFHFHMPSEHKILHHSFPMELHLVHKSDDGKKFAVIAWLIVRGDDSPFIAQFADKLPSSNNQNSTTIDPIDLPKLEQTYARYQGSLTTPPCTEDVTWTVMLWDFPTISDKQLKQFKAAMPEANARPSFPSHGRQFRMNTDD